MALIAALISGPHPGICAYVPFVIFATSSFKLAASKGCAPEHSSYKTHPRLQTSLLWSYSRFSQISGLR